MSNTSSPTREQATSAGFIQITGARTHNLKNISLQIPRQQIVAITGRSGSGKSSLAIDTLFAEGQRQYIESLSLHSRQFFSQLPRADVDRIDGLQPTLAIEQLRRRSNRRSTCLLYTSPSPRDATLSRMPSSA